MFAFTTQERKVLLFLMTVALAGAGIDFAAKSNAQVKQILACELGFAKLDINRVSREDLVDSRCLSRTLAEKIIAYRAANGPFKDLEEVRQVKGIGEARYEKLREVFCVP